MSGKRIESALCRWDTGIHVRLISDSRTRCVSLQLAVDVESTGLKLLHRDLQTDLAPGIRHQRRDRFLGPRVHGDTSGADQTPGKGKQSIGVDRIDDQGSLLTHA